jgi:phosphatidate cytidylyltransferase
MAATAGMAPRIKAGGKPSAPPAASNQLSPAPPGATLLLRFISAAILLPIAFGGAWLGGPFWAVLVGVFALAMAWEWSSICASGEMATGIRGIVPAGLAGMLAVALAIALAGASMILPALAVLAIGAAAAALLSIRGVAGQRRPVWQALGPLYVGLPCIAIIWTRAQHDGLATLAWMLALVVAVDSGAYAAGRTIGGPKLAPRISPKKTWAGLAGGVAAALLIGGISAFLLELPRYSPLILVSGVLAVVEQAGDLAESAFKRRFGVKDSSQLIPGHGGVLDRVDGLLAVALVVGLIGYFQGGLAGWMR